MFGRTSGGGPIDYYAWFVRARDDITADLVKRACDDFAAVDNDDAATCNNCNDAPRDDDHNGRTRHNHDGGYHNDHRATARRRRLH
jgi:hypothetical protein